ncbi:hypothetical protein BKA67DRAFT_640066 [Truncatella angustata]|uniref:Enoyl reductase (ER) domain-containing protein n=1 Tax=Truncatella angustata TaxID=152316 RepID=A0A9P8UBI3_9PEZI|nr:uncharacterized protein BKA67DRAFT_640066 [Truncatella angustata]KAH6639997.1 hypothetical protein BKA67DRAFT_640066 [Truncatella angustata]
MTAIRKVLIPEFGDVDVLKVIATEYACFTGADVNMRKGFYPFQKKAPLTPGYCLVGTPGDAVAVLTKYDAEAELVNQPEKYCIKVPDGVDHKQAAALPCDWNTAYDMITNTAKVSRGQRVFVHGMSGSVGTAITILSQLQGAEVYGTASQRNHDDIRRHGATPFVYTDKEWIGEMKKLGGADAVFDPLGYESFDESYSILSPTGFLVAYGNNKDSLVDGKPRNPVLPIVKLFAHNLNVFCGKRTTFFGLTRDSATYVPNVTRLLEMIKDGTLTVPIRKVWDMDDIQNAHRQWSAGSGVGSVLIKVTKD